MITIRDVSLMPSSEWDNFITSHHRGTLFHLSSWLEILQDTQSLKVIKIGFYDGVILIGALPLCIRSIWPFKVAASPFVVEDTPYMGLVIDDDHCQQALGLLGTFIISSRINFLRILQREEIPCKIRPAGYIFIEKHTHLLDLTKSEDEIWNGFEGRCRTAIRKAEKSGIQILHETRRENIELYYEILDSLYASQNMATPNPKRYYYRLWDAFEGNRLHMLMAWHDKMLIAGAIIVYDSDRFYYLNGASRFEFNNLSPNNLIQWEAIRLAKASGAKYYDFVGSDIERLAKFKKSFGGELTSYTCLEKSSSAWVSFARAKYPKYKIAFGRIINKFRRTA